MGKLRRAFAAAAQSAEFKLRSAFHRAVDPVRPALLRPEAICALAVTEAKASVTCTSALHLLQIELLQARARPGIARTRRSRLGREHRDDTQQGTGGEKAAIDHGRNKRPTSRRFHSVASFVARKSRLRPSGCQRGVCAGVSAAHHCPRALRHRRSAANGHDSQRRNRPLRAPAGTPRRCPKA